MEFRALRKQIQDLVDTWHHRMDIEFVTLRHVFHEDNHPSDHDCQATTGANWQYREAIMDWYLPKIATMTEAEVENLVVHELAHIILDPIAGDAGKARLEFATESTARALLRAYREGQGG